MQLFAEIWASRAEYFPGEHLLHCDSTTAPWALEYFPLPQFLHPSPEPVPAVACPVWFPYVPAPQAMHAACAVAF